LAPATPALCRMRSLPTRQCRSGRNHRHPGKKIEKPKSGKQGYSIQLNPTARQQSAKLPLGQESQDGTKIEYARTDIRFCASRILTALLPVPNARPPPNEERDPCAWNREESTRAADPTSAAVRLPAAEGVRRRSPGPQQARAAGSSGACIPLTMLAAAVMRSRCPCTFLPYRDRSTSVPRFSGVSMPAETTSSPQIQAAGGRAGDRSPVRPGCQESPCGAPRARLAA